MTIYSTGSPKRHCVAGWHVENTFAWGVLIRSLGITSIVIYETTTGCNCYRHAPRTEQTVCSQSRHCTTNTKDHPNLRDQPETAYHSALRPCVSQFLYSELQTSKTQKSGVEKARLDAKSIRPQLNLYTFCSCSASHNPNDSNSAARPVGNGANDTFLQTWCVVWPAKNNRLA